MGKENEREIRTLSCLKTKQKGFTFIVVKQLVHYFVYQNHLSKNAKHALVNAMKMFFLLSVSYFCKVKNVW